MAGHMKILVLVILCLTLSTQALAQAPAPAAPPPPLAEEGKTKASTGGPRKQLATIIFAGLGGAILGLSTLSFYGRPQDKLSNIAIGFAFGVIAGTSYVTYKAATNPAEFYNAEVPQTVPQSEVEQLQLARFAPPPPPPGVQLGFTF